MQKGKSIVKFSSSSLERVNKTISLIDKILSIKPKKISPTLKTPKVILDPEGIIKITGRTIPENAVNFFKPIKDWVENYLCNPADVTIVDIEIECFNAISKKSLLLLLDRISYVKLKSKKLLINWNYKDDDEDILEIGEYISYSLDIPFNFIKVS
jgi:hypothetical protein